MCKLKQFLTISLTWLDTSLSYKNDAKHNSVNNKKYLYLLFYEKYQTSQGFSI